ncbi:MAG: methyltransferase domain-containing protein [Candidatus Zixiibacteriota bacterium]
MNKDHEINREQWNKRTEAHYKHPEYKVKEFLEGTFDLHPLELEEVGDVKGKTLLHLQCHFGMDTLTWARKGATVTGADISDTSIEFAEKLAEKAGIKNTRFIRTDLFDLPKKLDDEFDIVYTTYGAIWWMSDIDKWAQVAAKYVKKGGFFYIADDHPVANMFDGEKRVIESYFHMGTERYYNEGDYCDKNVIIDEEVGWRWSLADIINALIKAGLTIEFLHEHPFCVYDKWPTFVKDEKGWYYYPDRKNDIPLTFSIKAVKR